MATIVSSGSAVMNVTAVMKPQVERLLSASKPYRLLLTERLHCCTATGSDQLRTLHLPATCSLESQNSVCCSFGEMCSARQSSNGKTNERSLALRAVNGAAAPQISERSNGALTRNRTALVWFKRDLRIDDHPGLLAASTYSNVIPLYIFDAVLLAGFSSELVDALRDAVLDLKNSLQTIGSDLVIRFGRTDDVIRAIAQEVDALDIITEEEVEMELHQLVLSVSSSLSNGTSFKQWRGSIYDIEDFKELPACYKTFQKRSYPLAEPLDSPVSLPPLPGTFNGGSLPSVDEIATAVATVTSEIETWESFKAAQNSPAEGLLEVKDLSEKKTSTPVSQKTSGGFLKDLIAWREKYILAGPHASAETVALLEGQETKGYVLQGGATGALNVLKGYLRYFEPTGRDDWQKVHEHMGSLLHRPGSSFRTVFANALALGTLSTRRVYQAAMEYEKERGGGWLSPFGFSTVTGEAAIRDSKAIEWYQLLALKSREQGREQGFLVGTWRWRGFLIQYAVAGERGPPVVFVHGFGAFWQHWRDNINSVAESGHRVFALTMLGFGRSEKPLITYTDLVWGELVRDFIVEVVREPVVVAGNSIGGYTASVVAGLWPSLVKSVVLLNSAGRVIPDYKSLMYKKPREKSSVAYVGSRLLLAYLQNLSNGMLTKCYPTNPGRADAWLQDEVMRASYDPNSTAVLEAMFHLRAPLPLNYYLDRYKGDILIIQGMRDPLHNSAKRASMLQAYCKNVSIQYVNAGHCPHDEVPDVVNKILTTWLKERSAIQSNFAPNLNFVNGAARTNTANGPGNAPPTGETNGVIPEALKCLKEEVEELV